MMRQAVIRLPRASTAPRRFTGGQACPRRARAAAWRLSSLLGLVLGLLALCPVGLVHANGAPVTIVLAYLDGVSTWGPRNATGISEFVARESELRLIASGLPQLSGEEYRVWIKNVSSGQQMALASFNSGADGRASLDVVLDMTIPDAGWNLMLLSVEEPGSTPAEPGPRRTLAGRWPVATGAQGRPAELPRTGGEASWNLDPDAAPGLALVVAALTVGVAVGFGVRHGRRMTGGRAP